jgi:DNA-binding LytR/AlgR family response regulator
MTNKTDQPHWKCVVAEDESLLRDALINLLRQVWPELELAAACEDGGSALEAITEHQPDVAFLDIRMPGLSGLEVAGAMAVASPHTQIIFVTAYDQYAIAAFDQGAHDYLLKPVTPERLTQTMQRLKARALQHQNPGKAMSELMGKIDHSPNPAPTATPPLVWLTASAGNETRLIMVDDVAYFQSDTKYTVVMTQQGEALLRKPIRELLALLDPHLFKQIHRSTIVNLKAIASIVRDDTGKGIVRLKNRPETLSVSQPYMILFRNM